MRLSYLVSVSVLVRKTDYNAKIANIATNCFISFTHQCTSEMLNAKIKEKRLVDKSDISGFIAPLPYLLYYSCLDHHISNR